MVATHRKPAEKESEPSNYCFSNIASILSEIYECCLANLTDTIYLLIGKNPCYSRYL